MLNFLQGRTTAEPKVTLSSVVPTVGPGQKLQPEVEALFPMIHIEVGQYFFIFYFQPKWTTEI